MKLFSKFMVFCIVGFFAFLIDWVFFNAFYLTGIGFVSSKIVSAGISMVFNFGVNRNFTFSSKTSVKKSLFKWLIIYIIAISANIILGKTVLNILGENILNVNIAYFAGILVAIPIAFLGSLLWAFKK